ncbi:mechanosensitive ion channel family protein [Halomarina salina]|uniref:Mechanosensitive ion channel family protein n=1 Tax=Halomarina salina TaxID=1872699 RepID=A0ABD5RQK0_9EURY|nr:mechanosensitive ion channel family protein [Halomarina salina]
MRGQSSPTSLQQGTQNQSTNRTGGNGTGNGTGSNVSGNQSAGNQSDVSERAISELVNLFHIPDEWARLILTLLVIALSWYAAQFLTKTFGRRIARRFRRPSVTRTVLRLMRGVVYVFGFLTILGIYNVKLGDITISLTVFSAVIGIVLAPIVGSYVQGLFVLADQPYEVGDMVELVGRDPPQRGFIEDVTLRYTKIFTFDNTFLVVPNGTMRERDVVNYSAEDPRSRLTLDVLVTYEGDLKEARELIEDSARGVDRVIEGGPDIRIGSARYPAAPTCYIENYADHGVNLRLRYWVREPYKLLTVRSRVQERIWERLDDADVEIAYPHSHVVFDETTGELPVSMRDRGPGAPERGYEGESRAQNTPRTDGDGEERDDVDAGESDEDGHDEGGADTSGPDDE